MTDFTRDSHMHRLVRGLRRTFPLSTLPDAWICAAYGIDTRRPLGRLRLWNIKHHFVISYALWLAIVGAIVIGFVHLLRGSLMSAILPIVMLAVVVGIVVASILLDMRGR